MTNFFYKEYGKDSDNDTMITISREELEIMLKITIRIKVRRKVR